MTIPEMLDGHAAEYRAKAELTALAAEAAQATVKKAAADLTASRKTVETLEGEIAELERALKTARALHEDNADRHAEALATFARHEQDVERATGVAAELEQLAEKHRAAQAPAAPGEALVSTGLPVHVKAAPAEPPAPDDELPFNVVQAPDDVVAALTGGTQMIHDPDALASKAPLTTLTDPPAPDRPGPRHEKPKRSIDFSGAFKTITGRLGADQPNGDDQP